MSIVAAPGTPTVVIRETTTWERWPTLWSELEKPFAGADGRVTASALPGGRAATAVARGAPSPEGIGAAHDAVLAWCREHGHELTGVRWELYDHWRDDPESFETAVYWQLAS